MPSIPITFTHEGKLYKGTLEEVSGAGAAKATMWHLMIDKRYWGQLLFLERGFVFYAQNNTESMLYLGEVFGEAVTLWYG